MVGLIVEGQIWAFGKVGGDENGYSAYSEYKHKFLGRIYVSILELDTQKGLEN